MARLVANRYGPELDIQRLFSPADKAAHGAGVSIHSLAYFSDNRLPSAIVRYLLRLDMDTHALPDLHQETMPHGTTFTATHAKDRRDFLQLCGGRKMLESVEARATQIDVVARAPLPDTPQFSHAQAVCRRIKELKVPALLAGGAVRDHLLGLEPTDYDIAAGLGTAELLSLFPGSRQMRNAVGTVEVPGALPGSSVEVTPMRNFGPASAACFWAINRARDAAGRDFSVNSLMMDPHTGDVFDCNGGLRHLRAWLLAPASMATSSLTADPVRCLRMLRFAARYGFSVDRTLALTAAHLSAGRLLSPPSNLSYSRRSRWRAASAAVHLDAQVLPEPSSAPRPTLDLQQPDALAEGPPTDVAAVATAPPPPPPGGEPPRLRDPRTPPVQEQDMEPLAPEFVGDQSRTLQLRREMVLEAHPSVISTWPAHLMAHEVHKMVAQDRVLPGALADAVQLALVAGVAGPALQLPVLEVAGAIDDRRLLQGEPALKQPVAAGWNCAVERLARMPPRLSGDQKLLTLLLGRTRAGIATVQPHTWLLYAPASAARRFDMFRTSLLFHRVLLSPEYLDIIGLPEAPPSRRGRLSPPDELDAILKQSAGDFRTLLAFEKSAGAQHGGDAEASPYFRSLRRGSGHIMWNLTYGTFGATKLQNPPLTARSEARTPEQTAALRAGNWEARWPLKQPEAVPWTHNACRPGLALRDLRATSDLPEPRIPLDTSLNTTFFRQALLRASAGCRVAAQARTFALIERAGHYHRVQAALDIGKGTVEAAEMAALDRAAAELLGDEGSYEATLAKRRFDRATRSMHEHGVDPQAEHAGVGEVYGADVHLEGGAAGSGSLDTSGAAAAGGVAVGAAAPHARMMHGMHAPGQHACSGHIGGDRLHAAGWRGAGAMGAGQWRAGMSGQSSGEAPGEAPEAKRRDGQGVEPSGDGGAVERVARGGLHGAPGGADAAAQATLEQHAGRYSTHSTGGDSERDAEAGVWHDSKHEAPSAPGVRDDAADLGPSADSAQPDGVSVSPEKGGIFMSLRHVAPPSVPPPPQPGRRSGRRARVRPAAKPQTADAAAAAADGLHSPPPAPAPEAPGVWDDHSDDDTRSSRGQAGSAWQGREAEEEGDETGDPSSARRRPKSAEWRPRRVQEGAFAADMRDDLSITALWRKGHGRLASPHSRRDRTMRHAFPQHATGFHALLNAWIGWDRLRYAPAADSAEADPVRWGLPESQVKQLLFEGKESTLEVLANLLHTAEARAGFRRCVRNVKRQHASELRARHSVREWALCNAGALLRPFGGAYEWNLPEASERLDLGKRRMDERRFTLDVALALLQARLWDEPELMGSVVRAQEAAAEMIPLHEALTNALTRCHLFDQHGALVPFVFVAELTALARVRARFGDTFAVPEFPRARIGDDFRRERQKVIRMSPGDRVMTAALTGPDAGSALVPDEVVREAWCRAAPWMHVSLPDWWAFKVWDRDMWIRTDTGMEVYDDRFRPGEQLYGSCVRAPPSRVSEKRDMQERTAQRGTDAAAQNARRSLQKRLRRFWAEQDDYLSGGPGGDADTEGVAGGAPAPGESGREQTPSGQDPWGTV